LRRTIVARANFLNLRVYELAEQLADAVAEVAVKWPAFHRNTLGEQIVRAADSIGANIAEGHGRGTYKDNRRLVLIARGSLYETQHWLRRSFQRKLLKEEQIRVLKPLVDELGPKLNAYLKKMGQPKQPLPTKA
jgi:four helix bundle protein